jgi:DNA excision repair protein ERCC-5
MDFSQLQIKHLVKRNDLTQKLINVTNNATNPNKTTPIRIASERNKKYVLVKNREGNAGWTMSSVENESDSNKQDSGTAEKPVYMDESSVNDNKNTTLELSK